MNPILLYFLLLKATVTTFSGLTSLPIVRHDLVEHYGVLSDRQLNAAVAAGRSAPGPNGLYVVSVGYFVAGVPGACAGCMAVMTPAFLIIPLLRFLGRRAEQPVVQSAIRCVMLAAAGLVISSTAPLARDAVTGAVPLVIAVASLFALVWTRIPTLWIILLAALAGLIGRAL
jgi:chromate transporter